MDHSDIQMIKRYALNQNKRLIGVLVVSFIIVGLPMISMESASPAKCKLLNTPYSYLASSWHWLNPDLVIFAINQNLPTDAIGRVPAQWYQYHLSSDKLEKLTKNPFQTANLPDNVMARLKDLSFGPEGITEGINASKSGNKLIYPRKIQDHTVYWFTDLETGIEANLGIETVPGGNDLDVFWFPDETQFITPSLNTYVEHSIWVSENGQEITIKRLADIPPFSTYGPGFADSGFRVVGLNPSGNYLLILPETQDPIFWIDDLVNKKIIPLKFELRGDPYAIWIDNTTFELNTKLGVIQYDIQRQKMTVLATLDEINLDITGFIRLSPDGKFLMGQIYQKNGSDRDAGIAVCTIH
ncbi:MAG: hypothetical protein ABI947_29770 [Chloroflexota bacterium]